jgi:hypothetical protein
LEALAFASKGEAQCGFCLAADYDDAWVRTFWPDGRLKTAVRWWHLCTAGEPGHECFTVIEAKTWTRLNQQEAWATDQEWYCNCGHTRYWPSMGDLMEFHTSGGDVFWMRGTYPYEMNDLKWMRVEADMGPVASPAEVFQKIQGVKPYLRDQMLRPAEQRAIAQGSAKGVYNVVQRDKLRSLPTMDWLEFFALATTRAQAPQ